MGGRKWTDEELVLLEELTEKYPLVLQWRDVVEPIASVLAHIAMKETCPLGWADTWPHNRYAHQKRTFVSENP